MKKFALLIGVEQYRDPRIAPLRFAGADARALAQRLREKCGFNRVIVLADEGGDAMPDLVHFTAAFRDLESESKEKDLLLLFFSGHGMEIDGKGYLLMRDSAKDPVFIKDSSLSLSSLREAFTRLPAGRRVLMIDACRNASEMGKGDLGNPMSPVVEKDIRTILQARTDAGTTTALLSACSPGQRAYEWDAKGHGLFTYHLLKGIDGGAWKDSELTAERLAGYVIEQVKLSREIFSPFGRQEPWYEEAGQKQSIVLGCRREAGGYPADDDPLPPARSRIALLAKFVFPVALLLLAGAWVALRWLWPTLPDGPWENHGGMKFVSVPRTRVLFGVCEATWRDCQDYMLEANRSDWKTPDSRLEWKFPAANVSWDDAKSFCRWLTRREQRTGLLKKEHFYRLPTDEEWSRAVGLADEAGRTPHERDKGISEVFPWGVGWPPPKGAGNYHPDLAVDDFPKTAPVGSFASNRFGFFDLGGNVSEWCEDRYDRNPTNRVIRGASYINYEVEHLLSSFRGYRPANAQSSYVGFRIVLADQAPPWLNLLQRVLAASGAACGLVWCGLSVCLFVRPLRLRHKSFSFGK